MRYQLQFRPYQRRFKIPLQTHHGQWQIRTGIILRLIHETGSIGWGEIAPLSWFGSETIEQAMEFCQSLSPEITDAVILSIPESLPACRFGFESAWETIKVLQGSRSKLQNPPLSLPSSDLCGLLPTGESALSSWQSLWDQGHRTLKWKIGVAAIDFELELFHTLIHELPASAKLRLDANGGLQVAEAMTWLQACDAVNQKSNLAEIEFLEQPLSVKQFSAMQELSDRFSTPIALDESVATLSDLEQCYQQGWNGIVVIKPAIVGSPSRLRQFCQTHKVDAVFSSVFETTIGRQSGLRLAAELGNRDRALGYGTNHWFEQADLEDFEQLWQSL